MVRWLERFSLNERGYVMNEYDDCNDNNCNDWSGSWNRSREEGVRRSIQYGCLSWSTEERKGQQSFFFLCFYEWYGVGG